MKILTDDRVSSIAVSGGALGTHTTDLMQNDRPRQAFISTSISETLTFQLSADSTHPVDGFFIHGGLFDSGGWSLQETNGTEIESGTLTADYAGESNLASNPNTKNIFFTGTSNLLYSEFISFTTQQTTNRQLVLQLSTSTDRRNSNAEGNAINSWAKDTGTTGRFLDSDSNAVNIIEHSFVFIGSHIKVSGAVVIQTTTSDVNITENSIALSPFTVSSGDTVTVNSPYTFLISNALTAQITNIVGDGTTTGAITVDVDVTTLDVGELVNPVKLGIMRCGTFLDMPNPRFDSVTRKIQDYSIKRRTRNGGLTYTLRNAGQSISMNTIATTAQAENFEDHAKVYRSKPFPVLWAEDMLSDQDEGTRYSGFFFFSNAPSFTLFKRGNYQSIDFELTEVV